jgi:hypothetical protein
MNTTIKVQVVTLISQELNNFDVEVPALKRRIEMRMSMPAIVIINPFTKEKIVLGFKRISLEVFTAMVDKIIAKANVKKSYKYQEITISDNEIDGRNN